MKQFFATLAFAVFILPPMWLFLQALRIRTAWRRFGNARLRRRLRRLESTLADLRREAGE